MMALQPPTSSDRLLSIYLSLTQYPILSSRIRAHMRRELFERGVVDPQAFESEVREKAILSQSREGVANPYGEEAAEVWDLRVNNVRDYLTDYYFSLHLPLEVFEAIVRNVLSERGLSLHDQVLSLNPELAPLDLLFEQAMTVEKLPAAQRDKLQHRLREMKVVLIRNMISDQLGYINIAKQWFTVSDLAEIRRRKIGPGRIGGKAAGMLLAERILKEVAPEELRRKVHIPESYFLGSDLLYTFMAINNLTHWNDQKYKDEEDMETDYPQIQADFLEGEFPPNVLTKLETLMAAVGKRPLIVRSSSLLEDNFGTSFAGKYESIFLPNQGTQRENLAVLTQAIARIYATILNPSALLYRRSRGLQDYDERMAVLIQEVEGQTWGHYFMPTIAGVAFSHNLYRWSPQIRSEDGFLRMVWGLGTRAVERVGNDYPRLVALSHPLLRPTTATKLIRRYSQQYVDLIDLEDNSFKTLAIREVLKPDTPALRYLAQLDQGDYFSTLHTRPTGAEIPQLTLTFEDLLRRTSFADTMRQILQLLEQNYHAPVDMEFTARLVGLDTTRPDVEITIVQCRPQASLQETGDVHLPEHLDEDDQIFATTFMVPQGSVHGIRYVLFVPPECYFALPTPQARSDLGRLIGQLNRVLEKERFICVGPGRWGTSNPDLGVHVDYADIYNACALVELTGQGVGLAPEPSFGTHFFQDMIEAQIYPLAVSLDDPASIFNRGFFYQTPNCLEQLVKPDPQLVDCLRLIEVGDYRAGSHLDLLMDANRNQAVAFVAKD